MGIFGSIVKTATKPALKKVSKDLSKKTGKNIDLTKAKVNVNVAESVGGALKIVGAASQLVPGIGTGVGAALVAAGSGVTALAKGDKGGAALAGLGLVAPGVGGAVGNLGQVASAAKALAPAASQVKGAVKTVKTATKTVAQVKQLAVKGLAKDTGTKAKGVTVAADRIIAAVEKGGSVGKAAQSTLLQTQKLAAKGNKDAARALQLVSSVAAQRAKANVALGKPQAVSASAEKALKTTLKALPKDPPGKVINTTGFESLRNALVPRTSTPTAPASFQAQPYNPVFVVDEKGKVHIAKAWAATYRTDAVRGYLVDNTKPPAQRVSKTLQNWMPVQ